MIAESLPFQAWVDEMRERAIEANPELSEIWPKVAAHAVAVLAERGDIPGPNDSAEAQGVIAEAGRRANADPVPVNWDIWKQVAKNARHLVIASAREAALDALQPLVRERNAVVVRILAARRLMLELELAAAEAFGPDKLEIGKIVARVDASVMAMRRELEQIEGKLLVQGSGILTDTGKLLAGCLAFREIQTLPSKVEDLEATIAMLQSELESTETAEPVKGSETQKRVLNSLIDWIVSRRDQLQSERANFETEHGKEGA